MPTSLMVTVNLGRDTELRARRDRGLLSPRGGVREAFRR